MTGFVLLEDGTRFDGDYVGADAHATGEVVFTTGMAGYQEDRERLIDGITAWGRRLIPSPERAERLAADLLQIRITRRSRMHGVEVGELRLPPGASVALIVRDGQTKVPVGRTVLRRGDDLLVVTPRKIKEQTERRLRSVSQSGRLASWLE